MPRTAREWRPAFEQLIHADMIWTLDYCRRMKLIAPAFLVTISLLVACKAQTQAEDGSEKAKLAKNAVDTFAIGYGTWALSNQEKDCPADLAELAKSVGKDPGVDTKDPWGTPYKMACGENVPAETPRGAIAVSSAGPDKQHGTADDIVSWKPQQR